SGPEFAYLAEPDQQVAVRLEGEPLRVLDRGPPERRQPRSGRPERHPVHRPRGADPMPKHAEPPPVLQRRQRSGAQYGDRRHAGTNRTLSPAASFVGGDAAASKFW